MRDRNRTKSRLHARHILLTVLRFALSTVGCARSAEILILANLKQFVPRSRKSLQRTQLFVCIHIRDDEHTYNYEYTHSVSKNKQI